MAPNEKLLADIETLKASLRLEWVSLSKSLTAAERRAIRKEINGCWLEMKKLRDLLKGPRAKDVEAESEA